MNIVNIFVLHYENEWLTDQCVDHLYTSGQLLPEGTNVVVIDNGSTIPYEAKQEETHVVRLDQNIPVVAAWNVGMQQYPADIYFLANNDAFPAVGCIEKLVEALEDPAVGIVAPGTSDTTVGAMYVTFPNELPDLDMKHVDGHLWGWRYDLIAEIGLPDCEGHTHQMCWGSNRDYCFRARQADFRVVCVRSAFVDHQHHVTYDRAEADAAGRAWLQQKWGELAAQVEA